MLIDNINDVAFIEIMRKNRSEPDRFGVDVVDDTFWHKGDFRKIWKSHIILTIKNLGIFTMITDGYEEIACEDAELSLFFKYFH